MKSIYKYVLRANECNVITLPIHSTVLSTESQGDDIVVYALVDTTQTETTSYDIQVFGTGHPIEIDIDEYQFLGTVNMYHGQLMFHVFYKEMLES